MSERLVTPTDEMTGLPSSIILNESIADVIKTDAANRNHAFHPRYDERLQTIGGKALRVCRVQIVEAYQHNYGNNCYHSFYDGPVISEDEMDQFRTVVWAASGYIPEYGIELSGGDPIERQITTKEMQLLKSMSQNDYKYIHFGDGDMRVFMRKVILDKSIQVDSNMLDKFLSSKNVNIRRRLGMEVLHQATAIASKEIGSEYKTAHSEGLLRPNASGEPEVILKSVIRNRIKVEKHMFGPLQRIAEMVLENAVSID